MEESRHPFRETLKELEEQTLGGLDMVTQQLDRALEALGYQDVELAGMVVADDDRIDGRYLEVHQGILSLLARQAPGRGRPPDRRGAPARLRCIERMGDQCVNIAKLVPLSGLRGAQGQGHPRRDRADGSAGTLAGDRGSEAFATRNVELARDLVVQDAEINQLNRPIFRGPSRSGTTSSCANGRCS